MADDDGPVTLMSSDAEKFEVPQEVALCVLLSHNFRGTSGPADHVFPRGVVIEARVRRFPRLARGSDLVLFTRPRSTDSNPILHVRADPRLPPRHAANLRPSRI